MALELTDLTDDERLALVALLELVVGADQEVSDSEARQLGSIVRAVGKKAYQAAAEDADGRFEDVEDLRRFLPTIERQQARELIYETVLDAALADIPVGAEMELLDWLAGVWNIETRVLDPSDDAPD